MTNITIYDCDYKRLENLRKIAGEDSIAELLANVLDEYELNYNPRAVRADLIIGKDEAVLENNLVVINKEVFNDFQQDYVIDVVYAEDCENVFTYKMVKESEDLIWLELVD